MKTISVRIDEDTHTKVKISAFMRGMTLKDYVIEALKAFMVHPDEIADSKPEEYKAN